MRNFKRLFATDAVQTNTTADNQLKLSQIIANASQGSQLAISPDPSIVRFAPENGVKNAIEEYEAKYHGGFSGQTISTRPVSMNQSYRTTKTETQQVYRIKTALLKGGQKNADGNLSFESFGLNDKNEIIVKPDVQGRQTLVINARTQSQMS